jgi:Fur family ferric uptake transcriptional regulator
MLSTLSRRGHRLTRPRQAVLRVIEASPQGFNARQIHLALRRRRVPIGLTSVYRTLDLLVRLGLIQEVHREGGDHRYLACDITHHHHAVCTDCGRILDFGVCDLEALTRRVARSTQMTILGHRLELFGRCKECRRR